MVPANGFVAVVASRPQYFLGGPKNAGSERVSIIMLSGLIASVIPEQTNNGLSVGSTHVAALESGQTGTIERVDEDVSDRALAMGIRPGRELEVRSKQPFHGPLVVAVDQSVTSISRQCAQGIELSVE